MMDTDEIIRKNNGDLAVYRNLKRLDSLSYLTRQNILSSVGDAVLSDLVDGTIPTTEIIKGHLARACKFYIGRYKK